MLQIDAAVVIEQGVQFAVVIVKKHILDSANDRINALDAFKSIFPHMPIVLMAQDSRGVPNYWGRTDIVKFLINTPLNCIPWKRYKVN